METLIPRFPMPSLLRQLPAFALASLLTSWAAPATTDAGRANPFFAFDNGVGRGDGWSPEKQAVTLARLGYAGIGYTGLDDLATRQAAFQTASLRIFSVYVAADVAKTPAFDPRLPESFPQLAATGTDVWLTLPGKSSNDESAVAIVRELAEAAARHGVRIVLYPHKGFFVATAEDALRVVRQVNRPNVGLTFNLAHELAAGHAGRLALIIKAIAPHLMLVSVNGADPSGGWEQFIRPLDEGSLDVAAVLRHLDAASASNATTSKGNRTRYCCGPSPPGESCQTRPPRRRQRPRRASRRSWTRRRLTSPWPVRGNLSSPRPARLPPSRSFAGATRSKRSARTALSTTAGPTPSTGRTSSSSPPLWLISVRRGPWPRNCP